MIIGVSGFARSGKDAISNILVEHYGYEKRAFADLMKLGLYKLDPIVRGTLRLSSFVDDYGWDVAKGTPEVRRLIQVFGTEVGRELFGQTFWVDLAFKDVPAGSRIVYSDVRFPNEANEVKRLGGRVWRVERPGVGPANNHASEREILTWEFDKVIINDFNLDQLADKVHGLLEEYGIQRNTPTLPA